MEAKSIAWHEPNRRNTPPLHIGTRGDRYSTLTGICWLDEFRFVVNHRSGLRVALFDLRRGAQPITIAAVPHLSDDVAARQLAPNRWEVSVSGCWDAVYSTFELTIGEVPQFKLLYTRPAEDRTFCHGIAYDKQGRIWLAFNTGANPRIEIDRVRSWRLPVPWGPRDVCFDDISGRAYAVATSNNPKLTAYEKTKLGVWMLDESLDEWKSLAILDNAHADACQIYDGRLWVNDQFGDRVLGIDVLKKSSPIAISCELFSFPHGVATSPTGTLSVTNYGTSTVTLLNLKQLTIAGSV
jgi:hypothetical protein